MGDPLGTWQIEISAPNTNTVKQNLRELEKEILQAEAATQRLVIQERHWQNVSDATVAPLVEKTMALKLMRQALEEVAVAERASTVAAVGAGTAMTRLGHVGRGAGLGLLQLGYAIDDLQYGFGAIVNNIPQLVYMFGGSAGLAGSLGIAAVAANVLLKHWDELAGAFGNTKALPTLKAGLEGLQESLSKITAEIKKLKDAAGEPGENKMFGVDWGEFKGTASNTQQDRKRLEDLIRLQKEGKGKLKAEQDVEGLGPEHSQATQATAKAVKEAIAELPGGSSDLLEALISGGMTKDVAKKAISEASRGQAGYLDDIVNALPKGTKGPFGDIRRSFEMATPAGQKDLEQKRLDLEGKRSARKLDEKEDENAQKRMADAYKSYKEHEKKDPAYALQDQKEALEKQRYNLMEKQRREGEMSGGVGGTGQSFVNSLAKASLETYQKGSYDKLKDIDKQLHAIEDAIKAENKLTRFM